MITKTTAARQKFKAAMQFATG